MINIPTLMVYIAGPLTVGDDVNENIARAMETATQLMRQGYNVVLPHLCMYLQRFWEEQEYEDMIAWGYREWMKFDFAHIKRCDVLLRMEGESPGGDQEVAFAMGREMPICYNLMELKQYRIEFEKDYTG